MFSLFVITIINSLKRNNKTTGVNKMRTFTKAQLKEILAKHKAWLNNEDGGERADLSSTDLRHANLSYANLRSADLRSANMSSTNLSYADLSYANLRYDNLLS